MPSIAPSRSPDMKDELVIRIQNLRKSFGSNQVLRDFNLDMQKGENVVVLGKSGSGKSVLIKCIIGLVKPDSGTIEVLGKSITDMDHEGLDNIRVKVGFLFQSNALYDSMTVRENLEFPLRRHAVTLTREQVNSLVMDALNNVGLAGAVDMMPAELSGGMKKRIALARTLILKPEIILYDEPTTGLDPLTGKEIATLIRQLGEKYNTSSIIISHDMHCVKLTADRIVLLSEGRCYTEGTYEMLAKSPDPVINRFFD